MSPLLALSALVTAAQAGVVSGQQAGLDRAYAPRRVAVLVGVQDYADPALQGLRFPEKDARELGAVLGDADVGGFDNVFVIEGAAATTADGIAHAVRVATAELQRDDTFLLYLSGHGTLTLDPTEGSRLWFLPSDGRLEQPEQTGLAIAELEELVATLPARRRVLVLDTCHNGRTAGAGAGALPGRAVLNGPTAQLVAGMRGEPPAPRSVREVSESEARLFAAQYHQPAMEDPALQNGVYTHFLIAALTAEKRAADLDGDGLVDVAEAHDFARDRTMAHTGGLQVPRAEYRIVGREEIYLSGDPTQRSDAELALLSATDEILARARLLVDGIPRGGAMGLTTVAPGRHTVAVQADDGRTLMQRRVRMQAGHTLALEDLFAQQRSRWMLSAGTSLRHGAASASFHPVAPELELTWLEPAHLGHLLRLEAHLRGGAMSGPLPEQQPYTATTGDVAAGLSLGLRRGGLSVGPVAEALVPWRVFDNETGQHRQSTLTVAGGARALWTVPVGGRELGLRYDLRAVPYVLDADWTSLWHHGVAVGLTTAR